MTTKLDDLVGYLAGREGDPRLLDEMADPESEASQFLEAARARSRALIQEPIEPSPTTSPKRSQSGSSTIAWIASTIAFTVILMGFWLALTEIRALQDSQRRAEAADRESARRLEALLNRIEETRGDRATAEREAEAFGRVEAGLDRLEDRLRLLEKPAATDRPDPAMAQLREELASLHRELTSGEKSRGRQGEELQSSVHEVTRVLKLLLKRLEPQVPPGEPDPPRTFPQARPSSTVDPRREP